MAERLTVPVSYVSMVLRLAAEHGVGVTALLQGLDFAEAQLDNPDARMPLRPHYATLCRRALALSGEPGLGYLFGLRATLTTHGLLGYGLMSQPNLRSVMRFGERFGTPLRLAAWQLQVAEDQDHVHLRAVETIERNDIYTFSTQMVLVSWYTLLTQLLPECQKSVVLRFAFPRPSYHDRFAGRLPACEFDADRHELCLPAHFLDHPLPTADRISAQLTERACARELSHMEEQSAVDPLIQQIQTWLVASERGYPSQDEVAQRLGLAPRTLTRHLQARQASFRGLLAAAQQRDSLSLMRDPHLDLQTVAERLGYSTLTNFSRACKGWHGMTPAQLRASLRGELKAASVASRPDSARPPGPAREAAPPPPPTRTD